MVEQKMNQPAGRGLEQIAEWSYATALRNRYGKTLLVAVSYDSKTKRHSCSIETLESIDDAPLTAAERTDDHEKLLTAHEKKLEAA